MGSGHQLALLLNQEISAVVTAMRKNSKWALIPTRYTRLQDDELGDDPLLDELKKLRRHIFHWHDWSLVDPMKYLEPFLDVIRSPETSGPITGVALTSLCRMLDQFIMGVWAGSLSEMMHRTADAVTQCKFEATDRHSDEVVLFKILQVLLACMRCPGGKLLTNDNVINIFQACFRIGHYQTERSKDMSELLTQASRQIMVEMVAIIFSRLGELPVLDLSAEATHSLAHSPRLAVSPHGTVGQQYAPFAATRPAPIADDLDRSAGPPDVATDPAQCPPVTDGEASAALRIAEEDGAVPSESSAEFVEAVKGALGNEADPVPAGLGQILEDAGHVTSVPGSLRSKSQKVSGLDEHGLESVIEILGFIISLINSDNEGVHGDLDVFGLELMNVALHSGGAAFERHEAVMALLREEVWRALLIAGRSKNLAALSGAAQVALSLYVHLGRTLLLQLEAFLDLTLLLTAAGRGVPHVEHQEAALEGVLDLCNQPGFIRDVYTNLDCRIERSNLFESITGLLSKAAFPVNSSLAPVHLLALNALYSILCALAEGCTGMSPWDGDEAEDSPKDLAAVWAARCSGSLPPILFNRSRSRAIDFDPGTGDLDSPQAKARARANELRRCAAETALLEKHLKTKLAVAADHYNRDYRKGFQYLQSLGLLEADPDPGAVARFLRCCPGLSKQTIGELLGENDDFFLAVLDEFTQTFDFAGLGFDMAIRMYLESFRLPGEAQKINRIMESFGKHYHEQCPDLFRNADVVYVLGYSVILLNTDQHNVQVKKKMTADEFIRNNRGINGGEDLPQDFLRDLYHSISRNEIRISTESQAFAAASPVLWAEIKQQSEAPRGQRLETLGLSTPRVDREIFSLMWGPTVAAVSVVLDHAEDVAVVRQALETLHLSAKIAAFHHVDEVMDSLVTSLSKFTSVLNPTSPKPAVAFGDNEKMRMATEAIFALSSRYGDSLHSGWRNILDIVIRLHKLNLLPPSVLIMESEDPEAAKQRLPRAPASRRVVSAGSMISRAFSSLISIDNPEAGEEISSREAAATQRTLACIAACRIDELFADSKFLRAESLMELVKAIMMAPGPVSRIAASGEDSDTAEVCLELVIAVALRNRDRILLMWPLVHDYLAAIMAPEGTRAASPLVARAALGLLRVCQRLLPYKEDTAEGLLKSLHLVLRLNPSVAWELASRIAAEVLALVKASGAHIQSVRGWRTVTALISMTALHPEAAPLAFDALSAMVRADTLSPAAFQPALDTAFHFAERHSKDPSPERSCQALDLVETEFAWLLRWDETQAHEPTQDGAASADASREIAGGLQSPPTPRSIIPATAADMWLPMIIGLAKFGYDSNAALRTHALVILHRVLSSSDVLDVGGALWVRALDEAITPLLAQLAQMVGRAPRDAAYGDADKSLRMGVVLETKLVLQYISVLLPEPAFASLWARVLQVLQDCTKNRSEEAAEAVPEAIKNMLLVLAAQDILTPEWKDPEGNSLWDLTWRKVRTISSGLTPQILAAPLMAAEAAAPAPQPETAVHLSGKAGAEHTWRPADAAAQPADGGQAGLPPGEEGAGEVLHSTLGTDPPAVCAVGTKMDGGSGHGGALEAEAPTAVVPPTMTAVVREGDGASGTREAAAPVQAVEMNQRPDSSVSAAGGSGISPSDLPADGAEGAALRGDSGGDFAAPPPHASSSALTAAPAVEPLLTRDSGPSVESETPAIPSLRLAATHAQGVNSAASASGEPQVGGTAHGLDAGEAASATTASDMPGDHSIPGPTLLSGGDLMGHSVTTSAAGGDDVPQSSTSVVTAAAEAQGLAEDVHEKPLEAGSGTKYQQASTASHVEGGNAEHAPEIHRDTVDSLGGSREGLTGEVMGAEDVTPPADLLPAEDDGAKGSAPPTPLPASGEDVDAPEAQASQAGSTCRQS